MHAEAFAWVQSAAIPKGRTLEIGSRDVNGTIRGLFGPDYTGIDVEPGPGVDEVADAATYTARKKFDVVVCCEVLEHTPDAEAICRNAYRLLRQGGMFIVTTATDPRAPHSAVDGAALRPGEFYANVAPKDLRRWLSDFSQVTVDVLGPDVRAVAVR